MSKNKSVFVTVLFAVMLAAIDACMLKIWPIGFGVITGALALYGYLQCAKAFASWLQGEQEKPLDVPVCAIEGSTPDEEINFTYDDIKADLEAGV